MLAASGLTNSRRRAAAAAAAAAAALEASSPAAEGARMLGLTPASTFTGKSSRCFPNKGC